MPKVFFIDSKNTNIGLPTETVRGYFLLLNR
jgi:hypothetical protein